MRKSRENGLFLNVPDEQWNDWKWQVENRIETLEDLKKYITLTEEEEEGIKATLGRLRMAITPYYLSLIDLNDPYDPIRKQAIPTEHELEFAPYEDADPLHEDIDSPCPGLTHRYPDRVLLLITDQCSMYCRHCTRRRFAGQHDCEVAKNRHLHRLCAPSSRSARRSAQRRRLPDGKRRYARLHHRRAAQDTSC